MTARTHDAAAFLGLALLFLLATPDSLRFSTVLLAILANQLGGVAPDIDQPTAPLWRNLPSGHIVGKVFGKLVGGHRFLSHSLIGFALFAWLVNLLLHFLHPIMPHVDILLVWYAFIIGYLSHLVMDSFTKEGVPWLLPMPFKFGIPPLKRLRITTGTWTETLVIFPLLILAIVWLAANQYDFLVSYLHHNVIH